MASLNLAGCFSADEPDGPPTPSDAAIWRRNTSSTLDPRPPPWGYPQFGASNPRAAFSAAHGPSASATDTPCHHQAWSTTFTASPTRQPRTLATCDAPTPYASRSEMPSTDMVPHPTWLSLRLLRAATEATTLPSRPSFRHAFIWRELHQTRPGDLAGYSPELSAPRIAYRFLRLIGPRAQPPNVQNATVAPKGPSYCATLHFRATPADCTQLRGLQARRLQSPRVKASERPRGFTPTCSHSDTPCRPPITPHARKHARCNDPSDASAPCEQRPLASPACESKHVKHGELVRLTCHPRAANVRPALPCDSRKSQRSAKT